MNETKLTKTSQISYSTRFKHYLRNNIIKVCHNIKKPFIVHNYLACDAGAVCWIAHEKYLAAATSLTN
jgi:hypothetical protein